MSHGLLTIARNWRHLLRLTRKHLRIITSIISDFIHVLTLVSGTKTNVNTKHRRRLTEMDRNMLVRPYSDTRK